MIPAQELQVSQLMKLYDVWAGPAGEYPEIPAQDSQGFPVNTLVKVDFDPHPVFFRILAVDHSRNSLQVRHVKMQCTHVDIEPHPLFFRILAVDQTCKFLTWAQLTPAFWEG